MAHSLSSWILCMGQTIRMRVTAYGRILWKAMVLPQNSATEDCLALFSDNLGTNTFRLFFLFALFLPIKHT